MGKSFEYSLPNKLFDFIHIGLPIISSPLIEVKKIINKYKVGLVIDNYSPEEIASKVKVLIGDSLLRKEITENQNKYKNELSWEKDVEKMDVFFN